MENVVVKSPDKYSNSLKSTGFWVYLSLLTVNVHHSIKRLVRQESVTLDKLSESVIVSRLHHLHHLVGIFYNDKYKGEYQS